MLEQKYGADALYQAGLRVQTTLDAELQEAANAAIDRGLRRDRQAPQRLPPADAQRRGRRPPGRALHDRPLVAADPRRRHRAGRRHVRAGDRATARASASASTSSSCPEPAFAWTRSTSAADLFKVGDLIEVEVRTVAGQSVPPS